MPEIPSFIKARSTRYSKHHFLHDFAVVPVTFLDFSKATIVFLFFVTSTSSAELDLNVLKLIAASSF